MGTSKLILEPFFFMRHGQTDWNKERKWMGQQDIPLNAHGINQARKAADALHNYQFKTIVTSPLQRAHQTATIINQNNQTPLIICDDLKECLWGEKEGLYKKDISWIPLWRDGVYTIKNGESFEAFYTRVIQALNTVLTYPKPLLIVAHGGVYWAVEKALGIRFRDLANCTVQLHEPPSNPHNYWKISTIYKEKDTFEHE